jgi:hypothetical protein
MKKTVLLALSPKTIGGICAKWIQLTLFLASWKQTEIEQYK